MIKTTAAVFTALLATPVYAGEFSSIDWASTVADIKVREKAAPQEAEEKRLTYKAELKGEEYHQEYLFGDQGALVNVLYYKSFPAEGEACVGEYRRMAQAFTAEYGAPKTEAPGDKTVLAEYGVGNTCQAVADGKFQMNTEWTMDSATDMSVLLSVWKGQPYVGVSFTPVKK